MAQAPQSVKMSAWLPYFRTQVATGLGLASTDFVRVVAEDTDKWPAFATEPIAATIWVAPPQPQPDSGAGRYGYFLDRLIRVSVWTRNAVDPQGSDQVALLQHLDYQDLLIDALLLKIPASQVTVNPHRPLKFLGDTTPHREYRVDGAKFRSVLDFLLTYSAPVTV